MMFNAEALYPYNISRTEFKTEMPDKAQCAKSMQVVSHGALVVSQRQYVLSEVNIYIGDMLNIYWCIICSLEI